MTDYARASGFEFGATDPIDQMMECYREIMLAHNTLSTYSQMQHDSEAVLGHVIIDAIVDANDMDNMPEVQMAHDRLHDVKDALCELISTQLFLKEAQFTTIDDAISPIHAYNIRGKAIKYKLPTAKGKIIAPSHTLAPILTVKPSFNHPRTRMYDIWMVNNSGEPLVEVQLVD